MLTLDDFNHLVERYGVLVLDGALATELEARGHDLSHPLWSGKTLKEHPQAIRQVHVDYYFAGADIATTASYQTSLLGLREHLQLGEGEANDLVKLSVHLARSARDEAYQEQSVSGRQLLVAGSIGPFGAYLANGSEYRGDYHINTETMKGFHRPRIIALFEAGVDLLALETMPNFDEIQALLELLRDDFPTAVAWLSCTLKDPEHLSDGTPIRRLLSMIARFPDQVVAVGANCVSPGLVTQFLEHAAPLTSLPLLCYPNSGEQYIATSHSWSGQAADCNELQELSAQWRSIGAKIIGGCCRTNPKDIRELSQALIPSIV